MRGLTNKRILITGAAGGIGSATAARFVQEGARVVALDRDTQALERLVAHLPGVHGTLVADVSQADDVARAFGELDALAGGLDVLINNAGVSLRHNLIDIAPDEWRQVMSVNLDGVFNVCRAIGRGMVERREGKVINICSLLSEAARPGVTPYAASKGAVKMLTRALAVEWAPFNVQVNGIGPGYFVTEMTMGLRNDPERDEWVRDRTPAGRWGRPEELVGAAVFLASPASSFVTGQIIYVDGGWLASL